MEYVRLDSLNKKLFFLFKTIHDHIDAIPYVSDNAFIGNFFWPSLLLLGAIIFLWLGTLLANAHLVENVQGSDVRLS